MSEIRDKVKAHIKERVEYHTGFSLADKSIESILAIPEIAVVDREGKLPNYITWDFEDRKKVTKIHQDMLNAGYVKEVKD